MVITDGSEKAEAANLAVCILLK